MASDSKPIDWINSLHRTTIESMAKLVSICLFATWAKHSPPIYHKIHLLIPTQSIIIPSTHYPVIYYQTIHTTSSAFRTHRSMEVSCYDSSCFWMCPQKQAFLSFQIIPSHGRGVQILTTGKCFIWIWLIRNKLAQDCNPKRKTLFGTKIFGISLWPNITGAGNSSEPRRDSHFLLT